MATILPEKPFLKISYVVAYHLLVLNLIVGLPLTSSLSRCSHFGKSIAQTAHPIKSNIFPSKPVAVRHSKLKIFGVESLYFNQHGVPLIPNADSRNFVEKHGYFGGLSYDSKPPKRFITRVAALLSTALFSLIACPRPALAASFGYKYSKLTKFIKVVVVVFAVIAGASLAQKVWINNNNDNCKSSPTSDTDSTPSNSIESNEKNSEEMHQTINETTLVHNSSSSFKKTEPSPLVTDLDAKIERLREREKQAMKAAEKANFDQSSLEKQAVEEKEREEARLVKLAQEQADREAAEAKLEMERRAKEEANRLAAEEKQRLEKIVKEQLEEKARIEKIAKEEAARLAAAEEETKMKETSQATAEKQHTRRKEIEEARKQPKSVEEELILKERYGAMGLEERAFNILVDLGMVDVHSDPASLEWQDSDNDDVDSVNVLL